MDIIPSLKNLGFSENEVKVYLAVLKIGASPVRKIAIESGVNRGTTYDVLKSLMERGVISYYHKEKNQYFTAENPESLIDVIERKQKKLEKIQKEMSKVIPMLKSVYDKSGSKPLVKYYESYKGVGMILRDVITTLKENKNPSYVAFSSASISPFIYKKFPDFTKERIRNKINVRVIAFGKGGEEVPEFADRKWMTKEDDNLLPNYVLIYSGKVAFISLDTVGEPQGVLIEDMAVFKTQMILFDNLWNTI